MMEPHALSADDIDDMADRLSHMGPAQGGDRYDAAARYQMPPPSGFPPRPPADSPRYLGQEDAFPFANYDGQRPPSSTNAMLPPGTPLFHRPGSFASERRPSGVSTAGYALYPTLSKQQPPPTKPLPAVPTLARQASRRISSQPSLNESDLVSGDTSRYSQSSRDCALDRVSTSSSATPSSPAPALPESTLDELRARLTQPPPNSPSPVNVVHWKHLVCNTGKPLKEPSVFYFDISTTSATLASKHGNNIIRIWSVGSGNVQRDLKISCYTTAQARSREYFVRSHAILSEPSSMIAIASGFGDTIEIWDWDRKKKLQSLGHANRWAAVRSNVMEAGWASLATYDGDDDSIQLYYATKGHHRKPFKKSRCIEFKTANLPVIPKFPELAFSATGPLLVTASGPRPPRLGHPPPERQTLLTAWEIHEGAPATPYKVVAPWQHAEIDTALPSDLATYGSVAVSIWIPASYRAVPNDHGSFNLNPVKVMYRYVLVWDFAASSTRTFRIPNASSACVSPDCRFVAYCDARGVGGGARGCLAVLDAMTGRRLWCWPDPEGTMSLAEDAAMQRAVGDLSRVTEMCFAADGGFLFLGYADGAVTVFELRETGASANDNSRPPAAGPELAGVRGDVTLRPVQ
ncbi:hypothetical protein VTJ83DRAFT_5385 [Remersonia thermophila]|uniref:WD40 repeat-like protein n=1 Tax=Remersonia thermophila TaxID=72144 RepID=A0ABR4D6P1_9PEZI